MTPLLSLLLALHQRSSSTVKLLEARVAELKARAAPTQYRGIWEPDAKHQIAGPAGTRQK